MKIPPLDLFFWTVRRNERDVINLYTSLSHLMRSATGGDMLNFGLWESNDVSPVLAQKNLCTVFGRMANLQKGQVIVDVGSGFSTPALLWSREYLPSSITCVDINFGQLRGAKNDKQEDAERMGFVNATARILPFGNESVDRVLALESSQHFRPFGDFVSESFRVLKKGGLLAMAIPVVTKPTSVMDLGVLAMTWSSEHYTAEYVQSAITQAGFSIRETQRIGSHVYDPLADYYVKNRDALKPRILQHYPGYVEKILFNSLRKMKHVSQNRIIDYLLVTCTK